MTVPQYIVISMRSRSNPAGNLFVIQEARTFYTEKEVMAYSKSCWADGLETSWFKWNGHSTEDMSDEEFKIIEGNGE